jgi:hypothetical protein
MVSEPDGSLDPAAATIDPNAGWDDEWPTPPRRTLRRRAWRLSLVLAIPLIAALLAAVQVDRVLQWALRTPTVTDEASAVCDYLLSQNYDALANEMDPNSAPAGASSGPFDRAAFVAGLRALDASDGRVTSCALSQIGTAAAANTAGSAPEVVFAMTVRRAQVSYPLGALVVVRAAADGRLRLSRASTFYYQIG